MWNVSFASRAIFSSSITTHHLGWESASVIVLGTIIESKEVMKDCEELGNDE